MFLAIIIVLMVVGSVIFTWQSPYWFTEIASNWGGMDTTLIITFWITGVVSVIVLLFAAWCVYKYQHKPGLKADYEPENKKLEAWLSGLTAVGVVAMLAPGLIVWNDFITVPEDAHEVEVLGKQWSWSYRYPGADGEFGEADNQWIGFDNPFGLNPDDPAGQDDILVEFDAMHIPVDQPVNLLLRTPDVLHDFYVPQFRAKMDMVPGLVSYMWLTPTRTGEFEVICAELCGRAHYAMRGNVVVDDQESFDTWLAAQSTYAELYGFAANEVDEAVDIALGEPAREPAISSLD